MSAVNVESFVFLLKKVMSYRGKPVYLALDSLPARKKARVREHVESAKGN